jgi:anaerobic ribonucleoside-triphosphate reductase
MLSPVTTLYHAAICKRDGTQVAFDPDKIRRAIAATGRASDEFVDSAMTEELLDAVLSSLEDVPQLHVEQIQDGVELALMKGGFFLALRAYIVYREQHGRLRRDRKAIIEVAASMNEYLSREDWRVQANANQGYSLGGLVLNVSGKVTANYWLDEVYSEAIGQAHREADLHIHDLDMLAGYCAGWSLRTLLHEGLNGVPGRVEAGPPQHLSSALGQMVNFLGTLQNEWAGAQAFSSFDTYLAPYIRNDRLSYREVR